ncbi:MAG: hypothetical protein ABIZ72_08510, partial [Candidatus Limnocylindrales bacterium]
MERMTDDPAAALQEDVDHDADHDHDHDHDGDGNVIALGADEAGVSLEAVERPDLDPGDASLLALVDRLGSLLDRSELSELSVEAGRTRLVLRKPAAIATLVRNAPGAASSDDGSLVAPATAGSGAPAIGAGSGHGGTGSAAEAPVRPSVKAPLTGIWYSSPAPGSAPFVAVGRELAVGQVIG